MTNILFEISVAYKINRQYEPAIDFGERLRLRDPFNFANVVHLVECYKESGREERAMKVLNASLKLDPKNEKLNQLKEELSR